MGELKHCPDPEREGRGKGGGILLPTEKSFPCPWMGVPRLPVYYSRTSFVYSDKSAVQVANRLPDGAAA